MRFLELQYLQASLPGMTMTSCQQIISRLRISKDAGEIDRMRKAVWIAQVALQKILPLAKLPA